MENNKKLIYGLIILVIIAGVMGYFGFGAKKVVTTGSSVYSNKDVGLEFTYKTGPDGYVLGEADASENSDGNIKTIILMQTKDKENIDKGGAPVNSEGPAIMSINIFSNTENKEAGIWAMENPAFSNMGLKTNDSTAVVVGGANAVRYNADGLYASDNVVVAHGGFIYVLTGMYIDANSNLKKDFSPLVDSIKFIETSTVSEGVGVKINIDAVCNGALAYMTFPDGASADKFVKDCKDGKHPEVIERYKAELNLGDGATI